MISQTMRLITRKVFFLLITGVLFVGGAGLHAYAYDRSQDGSKKSLRLAYFGRDVPAIDPLAPAFDPDSYAVITQIFDTLVYLDLDGHFQPGLATDWQRLDDHTWYFELRRGVTFHNGEPFDAGAVKFTYEFALDPKNRAGNAWILSSIAAIELVPDNPHAVVIRTKFPDGMFLNRLSMFGSICPPTYFKRVGPERFSQEPVGTGPYKFVQWEKGKRISLIKNDNYWRGDIPRIEAVHFEILPEKKWIDAFIADQIDFLPNLSGNQTSSLMRQAKGQAKILKRLVLAGYWVLVKNQGALSDLRVRRALNLALNKDALIQYADQGNAIALNSLGKTGEFGANPALSPYVFNREKARRLLREAGVTERLRLRALAADIAAPVAKIMRHDFAKVNIDLEIEVVSRAEWADRIIGYKITHGRPADYDLAINLVDNPIYNLAFHAGLFLHSASPWSLINDPKFDQLFVHALQAVAPDEHRRRLEALDHYIQDQAMMVFTTQRVITAALKPHLEIPKFALSGHLDYLTLTTAKFGRQGGSAHR